MNVRAQINPRRIIHESFAKAAVSYVNLHNNNFDRKKEKLNELREWIRTYGGTRQTTALWLFYVLVSYWWLQTYTPRATVDDDDESNNSQFAEINKRMLCLGTAIDSPLLRPSPTSVDFSTAQTDGEFR